MPKETAERDDLPRALTEAPAPAEVRPAAAATLADVPAATPASKMSRMLKAAAPERGRGAAAAGGRSTGKVQLFREIQKSFGNAYAQKVAEGARALGTAGAAPAPPAGVPPPAGHEPAERTGGGPPPPSGSKAPPAAARGARARAAARTAPRGGGRGPSGGRAGPRGGGAGPSGGAPAKVGSAAKDPKFKRVIDKLDKEAKRVKQHPPAGQKAAEAQAAALPPPNEKMAGAKANQVGAIKAAEGQKPEPSSFLALLRAEIEKLTPKNLDEADKFMEGGEKDQVKSAVGENVKSQKEAATGPTEQTAAAPPDPSKVEGKEVTPMPAEPPTAPAVVPAGEAMPAPKPPAVMAPFEKSKQDVDQQMKDAEVTDTQLQKANDPRFSAVLTEKSKVRQQATAAPGQFRAAEKGILSLAVAKAAQDGRQGVTGLMGAKGRAGAKVKSRQELAKEQDEARRKAVTDRIESIFQQTKQKVEAKLSTLEADVMAVFDAGAERALSGMKDTAKRGIDKFKDDRYSGLRGKARWIADQFRDTPEGIKRILREARTAFMAEMDALAVRVSGMVDKRLADAKAEVARGEAEIKTFVGSLKGELKSVGLAAQQDVSSRFEELRSSIDEKKNELASKLAQKYKETTDKADAALKKLEEENKGALKKFADAIGEIIKILTEFKNKLMSLLKKGWDTIKLIISDPIGFLGNLISAIKKGIGQFADNIWTHLKAGFMQWLFGSLADAGVTIPADFSLPSILKLVMQILGITYDRMRAKAVKLLGARTVGVLEKVYELIKTLIASGPAAMWEQLKEYLGDLKEQVIGALQQWVITSIVKAAILKLATMFNPVGAIVQAVLAIYNTVMFFIERAKQIMALIEAIVSSVHAIATGAIGGAANWIEQALARAIPVVLGFLARLLGLSGITDKIKSIIKKVQATIDRAIDKAIEKLIGLAKKALAKVSGAVGSVVSWWRTRRKFSARDGRTHTLSFHGEKRSARLFVESDPTPFEVFVRNVDASTEPKRAAKERALAIAKQMDDLRNRASTTDGTLGDADLKRLESLWDPLAAEVAILFGGAASSQPQYGGPAGSGWGSSMVILKLGKGLTGSSPSVSNPMFQDLNLRRHGSATSPSTASYYILGHLLNEQLGGPGNVWGNITPLSRSGNAQHNEQVESRLRPAILSQNKMFRYEVQVRYGRSLSPLLAAIPASTTDPVLLNKRKVLAAEQHLPSSLLVRAVELNPTTAQPAPSGVNLTREVKNAVEDKSLNDYAVPGQAVRRLTVLSLNDSVRNGGAREHKEALLRLPGIGPTRIAELIAQGPYPSWAAVSQRVAGVTPGSVASWRSGLDGGAVQVVLNGTTTWQ